jgi:hypothetical protein
MAEMAEMADVCSWTKSQMFLASSSSLVRMKRMKELKGQRILRILKRKKRMEVQVPLAASFEPYANCSLCIIVHANASCSNAFTMFHHVSLCFTSDLLSSTKCHSKLVVTCTPLCWVRSRCISPSEEKRGLVRPTSPDQICRYLWFREVSCFVSAVFFQHLLYVFCGGIIFGHLKAWSIDDGLVLNMPLFKALKSSSCLRNNAANGTTWFCRAAASSSNDSCWVLSDRKETWCSWYLNLDLPFFLPNLTFSALLCSCTGSTFPLRGSYVIT